MDCGKEGTTQQDAIFCCAVEQQTAMALAMTPSLSLGGSLYTCRPDKYVDSPPPSPTEQISSPPKFPDENCVRSNSSSATTAENEPKHTGPSDAPAVGDISAAKAAVCFLGIPEHVVQLAIDIQRLDHGSDFTSVAELLSAVDHICQDPALQADLVMKRHLAEQAEKVEKEKAEEKPVGAAALVAEKEDSKLQSASNESTRLSAEMPRAVGLEPVSKDQLKEQERVQRLVKENQRLKQRRMCRACKKVELATSGITFLPCGHFITCEACSEMFDDCPACGKNIMGTVRTFLS